MSDLEELGIAKWEDLIVTEKDSKKLEKPQVHKKGGRVTANYFKLMQQEVNNNKQKLVEQFNMISTLQEQVNLLQQQINTLTKKKGGTT